MNEKQVFFGGDVRLEGMLGWPADGEAAEVDDAAGGDAAGGSRFRGGVVVAHPYPPGGADMNLPVVHYIAKSCRRQGFASLRFNFRSVGASEGSFSGTEEYRDVLEALSFMKAELDSRVAAGPDGHPLGLVGWSFGSVMAARAAHLMPGLRALALVGLPVHWEQLPADIWTRLGEYRGPVLAVCAENDHHGGPGEVEKALLELDLDLAISVVGDADHYLQGRHREVAATVAEFFSQKL